jgi:hypothetical protein
MLAARVKPKNGSKETEAGNNLNQDRKSYCAQARRHILHHF